MIFCYNVFQLLVFYFVIFRFGLLVERLFVFLEILIVFFEEVSVFYVVQSFLLSDVFRINMIIRDNLVWSLEIYRSKFFKSLIVNKEIYFQEIIVLIVFVSNYLYFEVCVVFKIRGCKFNF